MSDTPKTPEQIAQEHKQEGLALRNALGHFSMKLRFIDNDCAYEDQIDSLASYNKVPSKDELKSSDKELDSYREVFFNNMVDEFFNEYPELLEVLRDKKTDNNVANFLALGLMDYLFSSNDEEDKKNKYKESVSAYYSKVLPKYQNFLLKYIIENEKWELSRNPKNAFIKYAEIYKKHGEILDKYNSPMSINILIRETVNSFIDDIKEIDSLGIDSETYSSVVDDVIIGKYLALQSLINHMAGGGLEILSIWIGATFKEFSLNDISRTIQIVNDNIKLNEEQKAKLDSVEKMLNTLMNKGLDAHSSNGGGCLGIILVLLVPISALLFMI